ncbi:MAG: iron ABC transporter substrate-binding protein, partial [Corynebacterium glutamicum]|nr:iron ABC transporter substrate-binding protein [Corynebacterium glutamicum]
MVKNRFKLVSIATVAALALVGCSSTDSTSSESSSAAESTAAASTLTIEDNHGTEEISLPIEGVALTD